MSETGTGRALTAGAALEFQARPPITLAQLKAYAEASGDPNPIHQDEAIARRMGLPGVIAHGMLVAGMLAERSREAMRGSGMRLARFTVRFRAMTRLGDTLALGGSVKSADGQAACLELLARNQRGETVCSAQAEWVRAR
jgi:acyl dehydratase